MLQELRGYAKMKVRGELKGRRGRGRRGRVRENVRRLLHLLLKLHVVRAELKLEEVVRRGKGRLLRLVLLQLLLVLLLEL